MVECNQEVGVMPYLGEIKDGSEIGFKAGAGKTKYIWVACQICGKERWVRYVSGKIRSLYCRKCNGTYNQQGAKNTNWKGGIQRGKTGYVFILLSKDDFFYPMANKAGYVLEHRLVMAKRLGRCLHPWEHVHHKKQIRSDNRLSQLRLVLKGRHSGVVRCPFCNEEFGIH